MIKIEMSNVKEIYAVCHFIDNNIYKLIIKNREMEIEMKLKMDLLEKLVKNIRISDPYWEAIERREGKDATFCKDCMVIERAKKRERKKWIQDFIKKIEYYLENDIEPIDYFINLKKEYQKSSKNG